MLKQSAPKAVHHGWPLVSGQSCSAPLPLDQKSAQQFAKEEFHVSLPQYGTISQERQAQMAEDMENITQVRINKREHTKRFYNSDASQIKQQQLFFSLLTYLCDARSTLKKKDLAADIFEYLLLHYQEPIQLKDLALRYSFHPAHIIRRLKQNMAPAPCSCSSRYGLIKQSSYLLKPKNPLMKLPVASVFMIVPIFLNNSKKACI